MSIDIQQLKAYIASQQDPEPFSGVVYLARNDDVLLAEGYGHAIRSESIPNRADTRFQTASGSKIFTSVAICKLIAAGRLAFDTPLQECVDVDLPSYDPGITIRHLLTHSSGITCYFEEDVDDDYGLLWKNLPVYNVRGPRDFLPLFQHKTMKFLAGSRFDYNNAGFILLGLVIECVTGIPFATFIQENVFEPAGMQDSGYFATDQLPERTAYAYIRNPDNTWRTNFFAVPIIGAPDGGAYSTAPDMAKFWKALTNNALLDGETTNALLTTQIATAWKPPYTHYGYGVWIHQEQGAVIKLFVEGSDPGVALRSALYPQHGLQLTVIGNTGAALWPLYRALEGELLAH